MRVHLDLFGLELSGTGWYGQLLLLAATVVTGLYLSLAFAAACLAWHGVRRLAGALAARLR